MTFGCISAPFVAPHPATPLSIPDTPGLAARHQPARPVDPPPAHARPRPCPRRHPASYKPFSTAPGSFGQPLEIVRRDRH